jgi:transposase
MPASRTRERALTGKVSAHHRFMLGQHLQLIKHLDEAIGRVTEELARRFTPPEPPPEEQEPPWLAEAPASESPEPASSSTEAAPLSWREAVEIVEQVTGISTRVAQGRLSEIGVDMRQFPSAKHLASWVGICPGHHESAGKRERRQDAQRQSPRASALGPGRSRRCP